MKKKDLLELIRGQVRNAAVTHLQGRKNGTPIKEDPFNETEFDTILFNGNYADGGIKRHFGIHESTFESTPKIQTNDIKEFEIQFQNIISNTPNANLVFDKQKNNYSIMLKKQPSGISVYASGKILCGNEGEIRWFFSIPNGLRIETGGLEINQDNKNLFADMADYYDIWQKEWRLKLSSPDGGASTEQGSQPTQPPDVGGGAPVTQSPEMSGGGTPPQPTR